MDYDESRDQSEKSGWKKFNDEYSPSEEEQARWSKYSVWMVIAILLGAVLVN